MKGGGSRTDFVVESQGTTQVVGVSRGTDGQWIAVFTDQNGAETKFASLRGLTSVTLAVNGRTIDSARIGPEAADFANAALRNDLNIDQAYSIAASSFSSAGRSVFLQTQLLTASNARCIGSDKSGDPAMCVAALASSGVLTLTTVTQCSTCAAAVVATYMTAGTTTPVTGPTIATSCATCLANAVGFGMGWGMAVPAQCSRFVQQEH